MSRVMSFSMSFCSPPSKEDLGKSVEELFKHIEEKTNYRKLLFFDKSEAGALYFSPDTWNWPSN